MPKEEVMRGLELSELEQVSGGVEISEESSRILNAEVKMVSAAGSPVEKMQVSAEGSVDSGGSVRAFCPVCGVNTDFDVYSGARGRCRICGNLRFDL